MQFRDNIPEKYFRCDLGSGVYTCKRKSLVDHNQGFSFTSIILSLRDPI